MADPARLQRLLGGPALADLRARLRKRYEQRRDGGAVTLTRLSAAERAAMCGILGRPSGTGASLRFEVEELDAILQRAGLAASLRAALELLDGPLENRAARREAAALAWSGLQASLADPRLAACLAQPRALGVLKRASGADPARAAALCAQAARVLAALPCQPTTRSHLAAQLLGDAHALDSGRAVSTLVLAALRHARLEQADDAESDESERAAWAACGILVNELARPVLVLNLPGCDAVPGEPGYLSLRSLVRARHDWSGARGAVFVCENPNIVAIAADALGARCAPLVCTDGMPAAAQRTLLTQLAAAVARLRYHGDFDWPGIAIGNVVMDQCGADPWRFGTQDYQAAARVCHMPNRRLEPSGREASWDAALGEAMREAGFAIDEEAVVAALLDDLGAGAPAQA